MIEPALLFAQDPRTKALRSIRTLAEGKARMEGTTTGTYGDKRREREWLDVLILIERSGI